MRSEFTITNYQIRNDKIIVYEKYNGPKRVTANIKTDRKNITEARKKAYSGTLTRAGKKRMEKAITLMCQASPTRYIYNPIINRHHYHKLSFVTLTVSDTKINRTAKEVYQTCLRPLLQWLTKYKGVKLYVWKAELQKRGQIHYHLATPTFVHYQELKNKWNYLQLKAGYLEGYYEKFHNHDPNSTDIHSMRKIKDAAAYLTKYFGKEEIKTDRKEEDDKPEEAKTIGKVWDCSKSLKKEKYYSAEECNELQQNLKTAEKEGKIYHITYDHFTIIFCIKIKPLELLTLKQQFEFKSHMLQIVQNANEPPDNLKAA